MVTRVGEVGVLLLPGRKAEAGTLWVLYLLAALTGKKRGSRSCPQACHCISLMGSVYRVRSWEKGK